jgi:hypothetical protein
MMVDRGRVAISLVEEDIGRDIAMKIAGQLVMFSGVRAGSSNSAARASHFMRAAPSRQALPRLRQFLPLASSHGVSGAL